MVSKVTTLTKVTARLAFRVLAIDPAEVAIVAALRCLRARHPAFFDPEIALQNAEEALKEALRLRV